MKAESIKNIKKSAFVVMLSAVLLMSSVLVPGFGQVHAVTSFKDVPTKHWAYSYVVKAVEKGIVSGYSDGTFKPDAPVTRAEFTIMLNKALGNTGTTDIGFKDVGKNQWFADGISKGVAAGFIAGYSDGRFLPNNTITRQEAAVMLARIVPTYGAYKSLSNYPDGSSVPAWAKEAVIRILGKGYLGTYTDNKIHMADNMTRAQAVKIIIDITEKERIISNSQTAIKPDLQLKDMIFSNKITVGTAVGDGSITFENCMILGTLNVEGGGVGTNGVNVNNTRVANCTIQKDAASVKVLAKGETTILNTVIKDIGRLETTGLTTAHGFGIGFQNVNLARAADAEIACSVNLLELEGSKCDVTLEKGTVDQLIVYSGAYKSDINMAQGTKIKTADVFASGTSFTGKGIVDQVNAYVQQITFETEPGNITYKEA